MANPTIPHLMGITLDSTGVATTSVSALNRNTGDRQVKATDANKLVIFDAGEFENGYSDNDVIEFQNVGASVGVGTITIASGFQEVEIACAAGATVSVGL